MYKNYVFDLYGTLVDINTNEWSSYIWKKMQEFYGFYEAKYTPLELKKAYFKICEDEELELKLKEKSEYPEIKVENVFLKLFENKGVKVDMKTCNIAAQFFRIISTKYVKLYEPVEQILKLLKEKNKKIYLLSNAQQIFTEYELKYLDIFKYFDGIIISSNEMCKKPSEQFFNILFERYKLEKNETVMIGNDWISDIEGANKAGIDSVYLHTNISPKDTIIKNVQAKYIFSDGNINNLKNIIK